VLLCVAVCCSVLQCVAVCCSVLQCVAVCCSDVECPALSSSLLQCVAACCRQSRHVSNLLQGVSVAVVCCCSVLQCAAVCCSVLHCVAMRCSALQCVAVCCSALQRGADCHNTFGIYCSSFQWDLGVLVQPPKNPTSFCTFSKETNALIFMGVWRRRLVPYY